MEGDELGGEGRARPDHISHISFLCSERMREGSAFCLCRFLCHFPGLFFSFLYLAAYGGG